MFPLTSHLQPCTAPGGPSDIASVYGYHDHFITAGCMTSTPALTAVGGKFSTLADAGEWLATVTQAGAGNASITIADDDPGGWLTILNDAADNDMVEAQLNGESFKAQAGKKIIFETEIKITDVSETDFLIGLGITDTTPLAGWSDYFCFHCADSSGNISCATGKNATGGAVGSETSGSTTTDTGKDLADATAVKLRIEITGVSKVQYFVDGVLCATHTTNICDDEVLTPTFSVRNDGAVAQTMKINYITCVAEA